MVKSSRKKLIVSGDSFTAGSNQRNPDGSIKNSQTYVWPDILAEKLDMECVNIGEGGAGNEKIHNKMFDELCYPKRYRTSNMHVVII
jgi:hypothetical protein